MYSATNNLNFLINFVHSNLELGNYTSVLGIDVEIERLKTVGVDEGSLQGNRVKICIRRLNELKDKIMYLNKNQDNNQTPEAPAQTPAEIRMRAIMLFNADSRFSITE